VSGGDELREAERLAPAPPVPEPGRVRSFLLLATVVRRYDARGIISANME
jgi:hypothetical protein